MAFFDSHLIQGFSEDDDEACSLVEARLLALHTALYEQLSFNKYDLHLISAHREKIHRITVTDPEDMTCLSIGYLRQRGQAVAVERLMGREEIASASTIEARRHPVIELRLSPENFVIELVMSRDAWWDQQNLVGKLTVGRHKQYFYEQLRNLDERYMLGFWKGVHLSDMHLSARFFHHTRIMDEWLSTFQPGADWFRLGIWYDFEDEGLADAETLLATAYNQIRALYPIYEHLCWSSDNNFREFYRQKR